MIIGMVLIMVMLSFSIYRIRKFSHMLVQRQIFANECLMMSHLASFAIFTLTTLLVYLITSCLLFTGSNNNSLDLMTWILLYLQTIAGFGVVVTMMIIFVKHSRTLSDSQQRKVTRDFMLVFTKT